MEKSAALTARLKFLDTSANFYSTIAPSIAAHLMLECNAVATENNKTLKNPSGDGFCNACGTIRISGRNFRTTIEVPKKGKEFSSETKEMAFEDSKRIKVQGQVVTECFVCHRKTRVPVSASQGSRPSQAREISSTNTASTTTASAFDTKTAGETSDTTTHKPSPSYNSSKKRTKIRKHGGLQAMLEKSKGNDHTAAGSQLNLMDFMKHI